MASCNFSVSMRWQLRAIRSARIFCTPETGGRRHFFFLLVAGEVKHPASPLLSEFVSL